VDEALVDDFAEAHRTETRLGTCEVDVAVDDGVGGDGPLGALSDILDAVDEAFQVAHREGAQQRLDVREVAVDDADRRSGAGRDVAGGEPVDAVLVDQVSRGIQQAGDALGAALLHGLGSDGESGDRKVRLGVHCGESSSLGMTAFDDTPSASQ